MYHFNRNFAESDNYRSISKKGAFDDGGYGLMGHLRAFSPSRVWIKVFFLSMSAFIEI